MDDNSEMDDKQYGLLLAIKEVLEAAPKESPYTDYENGYLSRETYYKRRLQFQLVEDIKELLQN